MRSSVLDSYAILVFLFRQPGHEKVVALLERAAAAGRSVLMAAPNWAEVRHIVERRAGPGRWPEVRTRLRALPIEVASADEDLAEQAGALKAKHAMSLADCFAAALAHRHKADLYTGDPEFEAVEGIVRLVWL